MCLGIVVNGIKEIMYMKLKNNKYHVFVTLLYAWIHLSNLESLKISNAKCLSLVRGITEICPQVKVSYMLPVKYSPFSSFMATYSSSFALILLLLVPVSICKVIFGCSVVKTDGVGISGRVLAGL